ncbi:hypothetical protein [Streptomyces longhuiensis]|uniref:hypothetical protein n=1 Tax=Streptomyces longhuiensis TaxID=2880933 RepID=UPI001D0A5B96|nr:hypothetical protein [Streptomyces longhuiensis]UDM05438.1 hypothetical protein LGI35_45080 [Streptomyces longhuiensis]
MVASLALGLAAGVAGPTAAAAQSVTDHTTASARNVSGGGDHCKDKELHRRPVAA